MQKYQVSEEVYIATSMLDETFRKISTMMHDRIELFLQTNYSMVIRSFYSVDQLTLLPIGLPFEYKYATMRIYVFPYEVAMQAEGGQLTPEMVAELGGISATMFIRLRSK